MTSNFKNPFSKIRAEQMGDTAWKYFVAPHQKSIGAKPLIFEGSRGTGKTMFLKCNSWKEKYQNAKSNNLTLKEFLDRDKHIGFYYKADSRFVKSLAKKGVQQEIWDGIFNTYFNIIIAREILDFTALLISAKLIYYSEIEHAISYTCKSVKHTVATSIKELQCKLDETLIQIEHFANNTNEPQPVGLNAGTIIENIIKHLKNIDILSSTTFHVFIDEYENLNELQQKEINTLLKQSNNDVVYDIAVITKGIKTYSTVMGQEIRPKDDFGMYNTDPYSYYESKEYNTLLKGICEKRLEEEFKNQGIPEEKRKIDITFYLKNYGKNLENELFKKAPEIDKIKERIRTEIARHKTLYNYTLEQTDKFYYDLTNCDPIVMRMHLALLMRKHKSPVHAEVLVKEMATNSTRYQDWVHNTESAVTFLLCNELNIKKLYHGFNNFSALSSGVIRSFLELAEYAFDYASCDNKNPFSFNAPRPFTVEEQTKAVYFVSKLKVNEINSYEPCGFRLKSFTVALGNIFANLQHNSNATLGEVEQNHFETKVNELEKYSPEASEILNYAIRYKILEEEEPTKTKSDEIVEITDYHLNHIYCPSFKISHLRKRKISILYTDLIKLLCGTHKELEDVVKKISGVSDDPIPNLFS